MAALVAWLAILAQQEHTAPRTEKADLIPAIKRCEEGEGTLESDPRSAIERFDGIIANSKLRLIECRLRIEERPSEYTKWYAFLPFQYRGRAKLNLARKSEPEAAQKLLQEAILDFKRSVKEGVVASNLKAGVVSSEDFLRTATAELETVDQKVKAAAELAKNPGTPEAPAILKFRPAFLQRLDDLRFKAARDLIDTGGKGLTEAEKAKLRDEAQGACRSYLAELSLKLRRRLASDLRSQGDLQGLSARELESIFALPKAEELVVGDPAIDWARLALPLFEAVRSRQKPAAALLDAAASASKVEPEGENLWFATSESLAFQGLKERLLVSADKARDLPAPEREKEKSQDQELLRQWADFEAKLAPPFREAHPLVAAHGKELAQSLDAFPVDQPEVDKADLVACFGAPSPEAAWAKLEESLKPLENGRPLTLECRRKLYDLLFAASALRALAEGKSEDAAALAASAYGPKLLKAGGPLDPKKYGPRLEAVYGRLR